MDSENQGIQRMPSPGPALALEAVDFAYPQYPVLHQIDLRIAPGEFVGLLGPNGSGKSTILRLLSGALTAQAGTVVVDGLPRERLGRRARARRLAAVPQEMQITFDFRVRDLVLMGRGPYLRWLGSDTPHDRAVADRAMTETGVQALADRPFRDLSGGEKQRVILAMALAQEPAILLLDEPTTNLDIAHQSAIFDRLNRLNHERGLTILAAIHDINLAALYCDRLVLLDQGHLLADGSPASVITAETLQQAYGTPVQVLTHPHSGRPQIVLLPEDASIPARQTAK